MVWGVLKVMLYMSPYSKKGTHPSGQIVVVKAQSISHLF